jgi:hypothetical protein
MKLLEAVCNITVSFRWQGIGEQELPHVGLKFWIFLKFYFYGEEGLVTWHNVKA